MTYKGIKEIAVDQFKKFGENIITLYKIGKEIPQREIDIYTHWEGVCNKNKYIHSSHIETEVNSILNYNQQEKVFDLTKEKKVYIPIREYDKIAS